jgi:ABC-type amino acid transport substrate-binding protein
MRHKWLVGWLLPALVWAGPPCPNLDYQHSAIAAIKARGVIRVATIRENPPFYWHSHGALHGYDYDVMQDIAKRLGVKLDVTTVAPGTENPSVLDLVQQKKVDLAIGNLVVNQQAAQQVYFSKPYIQENVVLLVNRKRIHQNNWQLSSTYFRDRSVTIAAVQHSYQAMLSQRFFRQGNIDYFPDFEKALQAVAKGRADMMLVEKDRIMYLLVRHPAWINAVSMLKTQEKNNIALAVNYQSIHLRQWLDFYITIGNASKIGYLSKMQHKYFYTGEANESF